MRLLITCGPSYEPIDGARRMTNFSTGTLGSVLANYFVDKGHEVICLKGEGSTTSVECHAQQLLRFSTNDHLARLLEQISESQAVAAVFHAAALCDYRVEQVLSAAGESLQSQKFSTRDGRLHLVLSPAAKVLPRLRGWFPLARIIGWKYELEGTRDDALNKAWKQLHDCATDACVLNGAAYGPGFALCERNGHVQTCETTPQLCELLADFILPRHLPASA